MKNLLKIFKLSNFKKATLKVWLRMPIALILIGVIFVLFLFLIYSENISRDLEIILNKAILTGIVTFIFSIGLTLFLESSNFSKKIKLWAQINIFIFAGLFFISFQEGLFIFNIAETFIYILITLIGGIAFLFSAPFIISWFKKEEPKNDFLLFSNLLIMKIFTSVLSGILILVLGFIALVAIFGLFQIDFLNDENIFKFWAAFSLSLVAPFLFIINIPKISEGLELVNNKFYFFVVNYLCLPAIIIYFIILYTYTAKVLINFSEWPQGQISWLVIFFSTFGYLIYFAIQNLPTEQAKYKKYYLKLFPLIVLPQTGMLFYAIFLRINQHDWTMNRYLVVVFGVWLIIISLYYIFSQKKYLHFLASSLLIVILIITFFKPVSIYVFPEQRQQNKLQENLIAAQILYEGQIKPWPDNKNIDKSLSADIYSGIEYLCQYHGCQSLNFVFQKEIEEIKKQDYFKFLESQKSYEPIKNIEYRKMNNWQLIRALTKKINIDGHYHNDFISRYLFFRVKEELKWQPIKVQNYDFYAPLDMFQTENNFDFEIDFSQIENRLLKLGQNRELSLEDMSMKFETEKYKIKVQLYSLEIKNPDWKKTDDLDAEIVQIEADIFRLGGSYGYVLWKVK